MAVHALMKKYNIEEVRTGLYGNRRISPDKISEWVYANFEVKPRKGGDELRICNPFNGDTKYKFNININKASCHCWTGDEWAGPINPVTDKRHCSFLKFVKLYLKCSYAEAIRAVLGATEDVRAYLKPHSRPGVEEPKKTVSVALPDGLRLLATSDSTQAQLLKKWLHKRGYTDESIEFNDLYYLGLEVYWPYYEFDELVYWQSRSYLNKKFNFPPTEVRDEEGEVVAVTEGSRADFLYGFDNIEMASYVIVTEAIFDQATLQEQVLASGGAILNDKQTKKIKLLGPKEGIILSPDNDKAGKDSIVSNYQILKSLDYPLFYSIPPKIKFVKKGETLFTKDWNELHTELGYSCKKVRQIHDEHLKELNDTQVVQLRRRDD